MASHDPLDFFSSETVANFDLFGYISDLRFAFGSGRPQPKTRSTAALSGRAKTADFDRLSTSSSKTSSLTPSTTGPPTITQRASL
jgi:hypothetical protein